MSDFSGVVSASAQGNGPATQVSEAIEQYGQKVSELVSHAKDFAQDALDGISGKIEDLRNVDVRELTENVREVARKDPGKTLLYSACAGLVIGLLIRGLR